MSREQRSCNLLELQNQGGHSLCPNTQLCAETLDRSSWKCGNRGALLALKAFLAEKKEMASLAETTLRGYQRDHSSLHGFTPYNLLTPTTAQSKGASPRAVTPCSCEPQWHQEEELHPEHSLKER